MEVTLEPKPSFTRGHIVAYLTLRQISFENCKLALRNKQHTIKVRTCKFLNQIWNSKTHHLKLRVLHYSLCKSEYYTNYVSNQSSIINALI